MSELRQLTYAQAICEALDQCLAADPAVYVMGLGVPDPKGVFGTTLGLHQRHGPGRAVDMPAAENAMTGVALGSALVGMRPVMTHQRLDFALLALDQLASQAANWHYMFGGQSSVPLVVRMVIGRGWGQGPQHSQSLQAWFAHIPGLKVVMPATPYDAKGLLVAAIEDDNPVIFLEHRWLHNLADHVPAELYRVPLGTSRTVRQGADATIVALSYMTIEALRAADTLAADGVHVDVIDLRTLNPLDLAPVLESVRRTGRLVVADTAWTFGGFGAEVVSQVVEHAYNDLLAPPLRIGLPHHPTPTSPALSDGYYPRSGDIVDAVRQLLGLPAAAAEVVADLPRDVPDPSFTGPF